MHFAGSVTGCQRCISGDHDQLVTGLLQHAQCGLALGLQGTLQHRKTGKTQAGLRLLAGHLPQLGGCQFPRQPLVGQGDNPTLANWSQRQKACSLQAQRPQKPCKKLETRILFGPGAFLKGDDMQKTSGKCEGERCGIIVEETGVSDDCKNKKTG